MKQEYVVPWKWVALVSLALLVLCVAQRRAGRLYQAVRRLPFVSRTLTGVVPGAGRDQSELRYPERYRYDNKLTVVMLPSDGDVAEFSRKGQRFMDIGGRAYSREFISAFCYRGSRSALAPLVKLTWLKRAETFVGELHARRLKPNFAYQVKLVGNREDFEAFERIGRLGRWSLPGKGTNISDREYARHAGRQGSGSYLLFDFFVTDEYGSADKKLFADSSLHVLFHAGYQRPPRHGDSAPAAIPVRDPGGGVYVNPDAVFGIEIIYAEQESGSPSGNRRPAIGKALLPTGSYRAYLVLTEESFHWYGDGGQWATVLSAPVEFEVE